MGWFLLVDAANGFQTKINDDRFPVTAHLPSFHVFVLKKCTKSAYHTCSTILLVFQTKDIIVLWRFDFLQPFCWLYLIRVSTLRKLNNSSNANSVKSWRSDQNRQLSFAVIFEKKIENPYQNEGFSNCRKLKLFSLWKIGGDLRSELNIWKMAVL